MGEDKKIDKRYIDAYRYLFYRDRPGQPNFYWTFKKGANYLDYERWDKGAFSKAKEDPNRKYKEIDDELIHQVLLGKKTIGVCPFEDLENVFYGKKDYDVHSKDKDYQKKELIKAYTDCQNDGAALIKRGFVYGRDFIVNSSGSKGLHLHIFVGEKVSGKIMRVLLYNISKETGTLTSGHEIFPKQEKIDEPYSTDSMSVPNGNQSKQALSLHQVHRKKALVYRDLNLDKFYSVKESLELFVKIKNDNNIKKITVTDEETDWYLNNITKNSSTDFEVDNEFSEDNPNCPDICPVFEYVRLNELVHPIHQYYDVNAWIYAHKSKTDDNFINEWNETQGRGMGAYYGDNKDAKFSCGLIITHLKSNEDNEVCNKALELCKTCKHNFINKKIDLIGLTYDKEDGADRISETIKNEIKEEYNPKALIDDKEKTVYMFDGKKYNSSGRDMIAKYTEDRLGWKYKSTYKTLVFDKVRDGNLVPDTFFIDNEPSMNIINMQNGILNLDTRELSPHNNQLYFDYNFKFNYNPKAKCKPILDFFQTSIGVEDNKSYLLLQEFFGYTLMRTNRLKKILLNIGCTNSGKSILQAIIKCFLPKTSAINAECLDPNTLELENLLGSWANLTGEIQENEVLENQVFIKHLSGNDPFDLRRKHKTAISNFINKSKIIINGNSLPVIRNKDDEAFMNRCLFLSFNYHP